MNFSTEDFVQIVPMVSESEIDGKAYVHWKSWQETYPGLIDPSYLEDLTLEKCTKIAQRWKDNILVAKDGERVVGFVAYGAYRSDTVAQTGEVFAIYVLREYQKRRIGYRLMQAALEQLRDYPRIAVWVLKGNNRAIAFYEQCGFRFDGGVADVVMGTPNTELRMILEKGDQT